MFVEFSQLFRNDGEETPTPNRRTIVLRSQRPTDSSFVIYHFIDVFLKQATGNILLISAHRSCDHYSTVAARLTLNLKANQQRYECISVYEQLKSLDSTDLWTTSSAFSQQLIDSCRNSIRSFKQNGPLLLILDSVEFLADFGISVSEIRQFLLILRGFAYEQRGLLIVSLDEQRRPILMNCTAHLADYRIRTSPIGSGFDKDITGRIEIESCLNRTIPLQHNFNYRLGERSIKLMPLGIID